MAGDSVIWCWRHPKAVGAAGRCIGRTDLAVDPRRAKRLAHRIRHVARSEALPREIRVSPLARCRAVGRWLRRWGWSVQVDARLLEIDFGRWDGRPWTDIPWSEVAAWEADLLHHAPGGGETLAQLMRRVSDFVDDAGSGPRLIVGHGGWINALMRLEPCAAAAGAGGWPPAPAHGSLRRWPPGAAPRRSRSRISCAGGTTPSAPGRPA